MVKMKAFEQRAQAIARRAPQGALIAEVGVLIGQMSEALLKMRQDVKLIMIDSWAPEIEQPEQYKATGDTHAFHDKTRVEQHKAEAFKRAALFPKRATILNMTSVAAAKATADFSLDMVFIDADHSYAGVWQDIHAWLPKLKNGGWIGGHDYGNDAAGFSFGVTPAVDQWCKITGRTIETDLNFTWFSKV